MVVYLHSPPCSGPCSPHLQFLHGHAHALLGVHLHALGEGLGTAVAHHAGLRLNHRLTQLGQATHQHHHVPRHDGSPSQKRQKILVRGFRLAYNAPKARIGRSCRKTGINKVLYITMAMSLKTKGAQTGY